MSLAMPVLEDGELAMADSRACVADADRSGRGGSRSNQVSHEKER